MQQVSGRKDKSSELKSVYSFVFKNLIAEKA